MSESVVVIGAGQAGVTLATSLRERGWVGDIHLIGREDRPPYQRPPLSKGYVTGADREADLSIGSPESLAREGIAYLAGRTVTGMDVAERRVVLDDGTAISYTAAAFATGASARRLRLPGAELAGVHTLRSVEDADALREALAGAGDLVIVGGGFIGLEIATAAPAHARVTVLEGLERILLRAVSAPVAARLHDTHRARGVDIRTGVTIERIEGDDAVTGVRLGDGSFVPADLVLVAVGASPDDALAREAGLETADGIVVDATLRTRDRSLFAIGDCARYPSAHLAGSARLESVQNATDQARFVARAITGEENGPYRALPWFWSHQGGRNLQIAGLAAPSDESAVVFDDGTALVVDRHRDGRLVAVETIDSPRAHVQARRHLQP